ncbi:unnamed protein product [Acanthoscelides obtectus]|uniref:Uncharacterized protein n=1 Tax=Acanthoscelides obtectus TaxID=200917 RepID=A0A9P0Q330_ACAOB|nr:unnamed protein product [Acanthoscelides obtectus]CAK1675432.1 hypothetical protein AOBTE_LOCUS30218 [Acanthoscelides obtectus]
MFEEFCNWIPAMKDKQDYNRDGSCEVLAMVIRLSSRRVGFSVTDNYIEREIPLHKEDKHVEERKAVVLQDTSFLQEVERLDALEAKFEDYLKRAQHFCNQQIIEQRINE